MERRAHGAVWVCRTPCTAAAGPYVPLRMQPTRVAPKALSHLHTLAHSHVPGLCAHWLPELAAPASSSPSCRAAGLLWRCVVLWCCPSWAHGSQQGNGAAQLVIGI
jgi:hypothetical protein